LSLTQSQRAELVRRMDTRVGELEEHIRNTLPKPADESTLERTGVAQDEVDEATINAEEHFNYTLHRHYVEEMRQIEAARGRAQNGQADSCADCGEDIGYKRLLAQPFAVRCLDCQARHEHAFGVTRYAKL
jgi:RNA polymerase-binding transcription factor DksA